MRILSLDGGGYLGLAGVSFLAELERHFSVTCHDAFDLFCGTSTGAIIALALSSGMSAREVVDLYKGFGPRVFYNPFWGCRKLRWARGVVTSMYGNSGLRSALSDAFGDQTLGAIHSKGKYVIVPAFCLTTGKPRIFKTDHADGLTRHKDYRLVDVALASSAAPVYLPVVELRSPIDGRVERYCDGGVFANHPAMLGLGEALFHLGSKPSELSLLSVSTPRSNLAEEASAAGFFRRRILRRGVCMWAGAMAGMFIDSTSEISNETIRRMHLSIGCEKGTFQRIAFPKPKGLDLDVAGPRATHTLETMGAEKGSNNEVRDLMKQFFIQNRRIARG
ncbi:MAG: patatin-like phospholipase family protein [Bryobacteraceae bacterium]|nr:patatin-like phospholipase family protein [Bryobacteraceae bacterium]